jgi:tRNA(Ile)-lysidine synthase
VTGLLQRVEQSIQNRRLLKRNQAILVAVSGGLDSMVLLRVLHALAGKWRWQLTVAHFNHQLRGRSSAADEKFVRKAAAAMRLPVVVERAGVRRFAKKSKLSIEMAARKLRHEFFARVARKRGIRVVALAHHADDQVELFFLRLLRGAGGEGLAGMKWFAPSPVNSKIRLVRPLLDLTKAELREFARENKIRFRDDATNFSLHAPRNRIRNELLPLLRKKYQPGLAKAVLRLVEIVGAEAEFAGEAARQWLMKRRTRNAERGARISTAIGGFEKLPVAIQRRVLQLQLVELNVPADFELVESLRASAGSFVSIGPALSVARDAAGTVKLLTRQPVEFNTNELAVDFGGGAGRADFDGLTFHWALKSSNGLRRRSPHQTESFDADKVGGHITLRHWRPGDRFQPIGLKSAVKVQDWFVNQKIPRARRRQLVVAAAESGEIFWIVGQRIGENFKLTSQTKRRLIWHWQRAEMKKNQ